MTDLFPSPIPDPPDREPRFWIPVRNRDKPSPARDKVWARHKWPVRWDKILKCWSVGIPEDYIDRLRANFSPLNVDWELQSMVDWSEYRKKGTKVIEDKVASPQVRSRRKTYNGMQKFIWSWMERSFERKKFGFAKDDIEEAETIRAGLQAPVGSKLHTQAMFNLRIPYRRRVLESHGDPYGWPYWEPRLIMQHYTFEQFLEMDGRVRDDCHDDLPVLFSCYGYLNQRDKRELGQLRGVHCGESFWPLGEWIVRDGWPLLLRESPYKEDFSWWCKSQIEALVREALRAAE